jgi:hypothetical protein
MAVTMKNAVFWDIKPSSYLTGNTLRLRYIVQSVNAMKDEIFTAVTMKKSAFWDVKPSGSCKNRSFGGTYCLHDQGDKNRQATNNVSRN